MGGLKKKVFSGYPSNTSYDRGQKNEPGFPKVKGGMERQKIRRADQVDLVLNALKDVFKRHWWLE